MTETRTCAACKPYSPLRCPNPVVGPSFKRYCSRTCQNRAQKERWRAEHWLASAGIRLRERRKRALARIEDRNATMRSRAAEFEREHPEEAALVRQIQDRFGLREVA
jgi:hypothetical protein